MSDGLLKEDTINWDDFTDNVNFVPGLSKNQANI